LVVKGIDLSSLSDPEAERATIGSMILDPEFAISRAESVLAGDDFHVEANRLLYEALLALRAERSGIDFVTVRDRLMATGTLEESGGAVNLLKLINDTPTALHVEHYASIVHRLSCLRRLVMAAAQIAREAYAGAADDLEEVLEKAQGLLAAIEPERSTESTLLWLDSLTAFLKGQFTRLEEKDTQDRGQAPYMELPWQAFRRFQVRLRPGMLAIVAGGSGVGKTTFMECCAEHWARQGRRVVFYHLELSHQLMLDRRMCRLTGIPLHEIEDGLVDRRIDEWTERLRQYKGGITYVHCPGWSAARICVHAQRLVGKGLCDVAIVDYLQKMTLRYVPGQNKSDAIGDAVEALKITGEKYGLPFMLGSQFNRAIDAADRKTAAGIRGSGEPGEKANAVITLDRPIVDKPELDAQGRIVQQPGGYSPLVKVRVDKNTTGPTGNCRLTMHGARFFMADVDLSAEPEDREDLAF
jgi:replicative DNA helicase